MNFHIRKKLEQKSLVYFNTKKNICLFYLNNQANISIILVLRHLDIIISSGFQLFACLGCPDNIEGDLNGN